MVLTSRLIVVIFLAVSISSVLIGLILIIVGNSHKVRSQDQIQRKEIDYTNCENYYIRSINKTTCLEYTTGNDTCTCFVNFILDGDLSGDVTVYYRLDDLKITKTLKSSRDDVQLSGVLSNNPSYDCAPYDFDENHKPIAPCGLLADMMFTDNFISLARRDDNGPTEFVSRVHTGMISEDDKAPFKNPKGDLRSVLENFARPKSWNQNVWELDPQNASNNGFQNERFIGWMKTDWIEKPAWRVNASGLFATGLPSGKYILKIVWNYPSSKYSGRRTLILESKVVELNIESRNLNLLIVGAVITMLGFVIIIGVALAYKYGDRIILKTDS